MWRHVGYTNNWWCGPGTFLPGPFGMLITLLFWIIIGVLVAKLFQSLFRKKPEESANALEILKNRYARGEISKEEFEQAQQVLK